MSVWLGMGSRRPRHPRSRAEHPVARRARGYLYAQPTLTIATAIFLIAVGAILRYAINVESDVINIQTVGLILMIAGGAGLALSLLYELVQQGGGKDDESPERRGGYDDPTRRL